MTIIQTGDEQVAKNALLNLQMSSVREVFNKMIEFLGPPHEADSIGDGEELADDLEKIAPQPDEMPDMVYTELIGRCQQLTELRKINIKLDEQSIPEILDECDYIDGCEVENYLTIAIDEKKFVEHTIKLACDHYSS